MGMNIVFGKQYRFRGQMVVTEYEYWNQDPCRTRNFKPQTQDYISSYVQLCGWQTMGLNIVNVPLTQE